jgi:hypothetical protein
MTQSVRLYVYLREKRGCMFKRVEYVRAEGRESKGKGEARGARRGEGRDARGEKGGMLGRLEGRGCWEVRRGGL